MDMTLSDAVLSDQELDNLPLSEVRRRKARADGVAPEPLSAEMAAAEANQSAAKKRMNALKSQRLPVLVPFGFEGETFYIKRLSYEDLVTVALTITRDGHNAVNITDEEGALSAWVAILLHAVANEDGTPYFEYDDVREYLSEPGEAALVSALTEECVRVNPDLFATLKKRF